MLSSDPMMLGLLTLPSQKIFGPGLDFPCIPGLINAPFTQFWSKVFFPQSLWLFSANTKLPSEDKVRT